MSRQLVQAYYTAIDAGDIDAALSGWRADATYRRPGYEALVGLDAVRSFYQSARVIADGQHVLDTVVVQPGSIAVEGSFTGRHKDGSTLTVRFADFWRLIENQVVERNTYYDSPAV